MGLCQRAEKASLSNSFLAMVHRPPRGRTAGNGSGPRCTESYTWFCEGFGPDTGFDCEPLASGIYIYIYPTPNQTAGPIETRPHEGPYLWRFSPKHVC